MVLKAKELLTTYLIEIFLLSTYFYPQSYPNWKPTERF